MQWRSFVFLPIKLKFSTKVLNVSVILCTKYKNHVIVVARSFPSDGGMSEDHGSPEAGQLIRIWTRDRIETEGR